MMGFLEHVTLGFCWWDFPALLLLIAVTAWFFMKRHKLNEDKKELQDQLSEKYIKSKSFRKNQENYFVEIKPKNECNEV